MSDIPTEEEIPFADECDDDDSVVDADDAIDFDEDEMDPVDKEIDSSTTS